MVIPRSVNPNGEGSLAVNWVKSEENRGGSAADEDVAPWLFESAGRKGCVSSRISGWW